MIPVVNVTLANGNIGAAVNTNDGVVGQILTGAGTGDIALLTPAKVVSLTDAVAQGFTQADEPEAYQFCKDFYSLAPNGSILYLMLAANTASLVNLCDKTNANGAKKLIDFSQGTIRVLGVSRTPAVDYVPTTVEFIDSDVISAMTNAQALQLDCFSKHIPLRVVLAARVADETNATIFAPNTSNTNGVALAIGGVSPGGGVSMGIILAKVAATAPHVNIGRVKDGDLLINSWYIGTKPVVAIGGTAPYAGLNTLIDNGYISVTGYPQKAGLFISDDPMSVAATDDYRFLANCRVIDKASIIAYQTYLTRLKDDVDLNGDGTVAPIVIKGLEKSIVTAIGLSMSENISGEANCYIDPAQNLATGSTLKVKLRLTPKGYLKDIEVELGFGLN